MKNIINRITVLLGLSAAVIAGVATSSQAQENEIHRIVTTIDKSGKSAALSNSMVPLKIGGAGEGVATLLRQKVLPTSPGTKTDLGREKALRRIPGAPRCSSSTFRRGARGEQARHEYDDERNGRRRAQAWTSAEQSADAPNPHGRLCDGSVGGDRHDAGC